MQRFIDPCVDYAFKELFGDPANELALLSFVNAVVRPASPFVRLTILNPFNEREIEAAHGPPRDTRAGAAEVAVIHAP